MMDLHTIHIQSRFYGKYVDVFKKNYYICHLFGQRLVAGESIISFFA